MRKNKNALTLAVCVAATLGGSSSTWSEEPKTQDQETTSAPKTQDQKSTSWDMSPTAAPFTAPESVYSFGVSVLDGDRQQRGMFDGREDDKTWVLLDARLRSRDDATGTWGIAEGHDLGLTDNRDLLLGYERQGEWGLRFEYLEIPRIAPYTANSKNEGLGTSKQIIANSTKFGDGQTYHIETERDRLIFNAFHTLNNHIKFNVNFKHETKEGTRQWGRGSANEFLLEPIDYRTLQFDPTIGYSASDLQLLGGYSGSWFRNENALVDTYLQGDDTSKLASHTYLVLPLDNEAHQFYLTSGYNFSPVTRVNLKISYNRAQSNEHLPTTDIAGLSYANGPTRLDGEVNTTSMLLGFTTQPLPGLSITTKLRYFDEDDQTPGWLVVDIPAAPKAKPPTPEIQVHSTPVSLRTMTSQLEGTYRLPYETTLTGGVEHKDQKRQVPFGNDIVADGLDDERFVPWRTDLDETTFRLRLGRSLSETIDGSIGVEHGIRKGSEYTDSVKIMGNAQGKINPFFIADRDRDKVRLAMDWRPLERLGVQVNVENAMDRYGPEQEPYGRRKGSAQLYSVDVDYTPVDKWLLTSWYSYDINKTWQDGGRWGSTGVHEADKSSVLKDIGSSLGLGVRNQWNEKVKLGSDVQWTRIKSSFDESVSVDPVSAATPAYPSGVTPLGEIITPSTRLNTFLEYKGLGPGILRCDYTHERWSSNDWTWKFSDGSSYVYSAKTDGTLIETKDTQSSDFFGVMYTTHFK
ncbi:MAG: MtrB/PioB family decaheme-associated outer membrane protein [Magnetococcales bacterium]|nr:MtrB/PioB family decaheme-associated outer membrane protein [Magnetococcales bacterium]MBF0148428.1 MtrB/PioB family decaheme-associated outer membrane protein [Magnetococcales bacterium]MBF0173053.1 MtrB/PioB family decaheme-associated outer membrane protein [Magnetococcales bacterium]